MCLLLLTFSPRSQLHKQSEWDLAHKAWGLWFSQPWDQFLGSGGPVMVASIHSRAPLSLVSHSAVSVTCGQLLWVLRAEVTRSPIQETMKVELC